MIGRIFVIGPTLSIPSRDGRQFLKRELTLDAAQYNPVTGEKMFDNFPSFEFSGEKCQELDQYRNGDIVTVSFDIRGRFYKKEGEDEDRHINAIIGYKIERYVPAGHNQQQVQQSPNQIPQQTEAIQVNQAADFPPKVDENGNPQSDDLPF